MQIVSTNFRVSSDTKESNSHRKPKRMKLINTNATNNGTLATENYILNNHVTLYYWNSSNNVNENCIQNSFNPISGSSKEL